MENNNNDHRPHRLFLNGQPVNLQDDMSRISESTVSSPQQHPRPEMVAHPDLQVMGDRARHPPVEARHHPPPVAPGGPLLQAMVDFFIRQFLTYVREGNENMVDEAMQILLSSDDGAHGMIGQQLDEAALEAYGEDIMSGNHQAAERLKIFLHLRGRDIAEF